MKNIFPLVLLAGGAWILANAGSKKIPTKSTKPPTDSKAEEMKKKNLENLKKYYSATPIPIPEGIMVDLTENLKNEVYNQQYSVHLQPEVAEEAYDFAYNEVYKGKKPIESPKAADPITLEVLKNLMPDVAWNEGLTPYDFDTPFAWVWKSVNFIVWLASKNLVEKGVIL